MAQVTITNLVGITKLDPKIIRRLIRKSQLHRKGDPYTWDETNLEYKKILDYLQKAATEIAKPKPPKAKKERRAKEPITWNDRGLCEIAGHLWAVVGVPQVNTPSTLDQKSICLGKTAEAMEILNRQKEIPEEMGHLQKLAFHQLLERKRK